MPLGHHRRQIKRRAQQGIPRLGDRSLSRPLAGLTDAGIEAGIGDHLFDRAESVQRAEKGQQGGGCVVPNTGNTGQQLLLFFEMRVLIDVALDLLTYLVDLLLYNGQDSLHRLPRWALGGFQAVVFHRLQCQEILQTMHQGLEDHDLFGRRHPGCRAVHLAIPGNEPGIGLVRLGPGQFCLAKGMNLGWVDHADELLLRQKARQVPPIGARSLHAEMGLSGVVPGQPLQELPIAYGGVGEDFTAILVFSVQKGYIESLLSGDLVE